MVSSLENEFWPARDRKRDHFRFQKDFYFDQKRTLIKSERNEMEWNGMQKAHDP